MTIPPSSCTRDFDAYLRLNRALPWEWIAALRRLTGNNDFQCLAEFSQSELGSLSSLCVNEGRFIHFCASHTFRLHTDSMSTFSLILVTNRKPDSAMQGERRWDSGSVMAIAPGENLDLLIDAGSRVILVQPELRAPELSTPVKRSKDLSRMVGDYLSRARFFRNHGDAVVATGTLIRELCRVMDGGPAPEPAPELDRRLLRVIARIEEEGRWDFNLGELATYSGVSERNLYYLMKRETGLTPYRLYQRQRLLRVRRRLVDCRCGHPHISWYAADEGFSHLGRFAGIYRQHFGELPSETVQWRRLPEPNPEGAQTLAVY